MHHSFLTVINGAGPLCSIQRLKPCTTICFSSFAFNFKLRRYT